MKVVAAYLLANLAGAASPTKDDITKILSSVGAEADAERVDQLLKEMEGKDVQEVVSAGLSKLASVPAGGAVAAAPAAGGAAAGGAAAAAEAAPAAKEEEEEEEDMGFSLFD